MNRLTQKLGNKIYIIPHEERYTYGLRSEIIQALGEYEDLELTPEQIREIDRLYSDKCKEVAELQEKIKELKLEYKLESDILKKVERSNVDLIDEIMMYRGKIADGSLIELPCKVGDTVYILNTYCNRENWKIYKRKVSKFVYEQYRCKRVEIYFQEGRGYVLDGMIGDTVFLTREEAEQALQRMKGE